jgi:hypothetical protein
MAGLTHSEAIDMLPHTTPKGCRFTATYTDGMREVRSPSPNPVGKSPRKSQ